MASSGRLRRLYPKFCIVTACGGDHYGLGYCRRHHAQVERRGHVRDPQAENQLRDLIARPRQYGADLLLMGREMKRALGELEDEILRLKVAPADSMLFQVQARCRIVGDHVERLGLAWKGVFGAACEESGCPNPQTKTGRLCIVHQTRRYATSHARRIRAGREAEARRAEAEEVRERRSPEMHVDRVDNSIAIYLSMRAAR